MFMFSKTELFLNGADVTELRGRSEWMRGYKTEMVGKVKWWWWGDRRWH